MPSIYDYINRFRDTVDNAWGDSADNVWRKIIRFVSTYTRGTQERDTAIAKKSAQADYGRKPYMYGLKRHSPKSDYTDMMREVPQSAMMDQKLAKDSEFDKPYLHEDYQEMEYLWPWPEGHEPFEMPMSRIPTEQRWQGQGCIINLQNPHECNQPVWGSLSIFQFVGPASQRYSELKFQIKLNGKTQKRYDFTVENRIFPLWINPPFKDNTLGDDYAYRWQSALKSDPDVLEVTMRDGAGNICSDKLTVRPTGCPEEDICDCDTADTFQLDTNNTPSTIVSGETVTVYVLGGCPPFTWGPTSGDYWFESALTYGRDNVLHAGGGGCGNIASYTSLNITDNCGVIPLGGIVIRMTDGEWGDWASVCGGAGCADPRCCETGTIDFEQYKYRAGDYQDGDSMECEDDCCADALLRVPYSAGYGCGFVCINDGDPSCNPGADLDCCARWVAGAGNDPQAIKTIKVSRAEWICP